MARVEIGRYLMTDTRVCGGRLIFKGTRILVADALELMDAGLTPERIAQEYKGLISSEAVQEAVSFRKKGIVREILSKTQKAA